MTYLPAYLPNVSTYQSYPQGGLPFDIYDKVQEVYGEDVARLVVHADNTFLIGR